MSRIVIFGAQQFAERVHYYFTRDSHHEVAAFTVDRAYREADSFLDQPLVDFESVTQRCPPSSYKMFIALGYSRMNKLSAEKYFQAKELGYELVSYISSRCILLTDYPLGDNCFVGAGTIIQPFARMGSNVKLLAGSHISHHAVIEDHCYVSPNAMVLGNAHICSYCFIGASATVRNGITVAPETLVGAGALIMEDTVEKGVYVPPRTLLLDRKSDEIEI